MFQPLLLQNFLFSSKINSVVFKSLVTLRRDGERVTGAVLPSLQRFRSKCSSTVREKTAWTCSWSWSFCWGTGWTRFTRNTTCNGVLQVRPQISEYSSRQISIEDASIGGMEPFKVTSCLRNTAASGSFRCAEEVSFAWGLLIGFPAMEGLRGNRQFPALLSPLPYTRKNISAPSAVFPIQQKLHTSQKSLELCI